MPVCVLESNSCELGRLGASRLKYGVERALVMRRRRRDLGMVLRRGHRRLRGGSLGGRIRLAFPVAMSATTRIRKASPKEEDAPVTRCASMPEEEVRGIYRAGYVDTTVGREKLPLSFSLRTHTIIHEPTADR